MIHKSYKTEFGSGNEYFDAFRHRKCISSFLLRFGDVENESTTYFIYLLAGVLCFSHQCIST